LLTACHEQDYWSDPAGQPGTGKKPEAADFAINCLTL
jgi:hypothetical protein